MYPTTFISIVLGFWSIFHLSHTFLLKSPYFGRRLEYFILSNNLTISYFHIRWVTTRWNRLLIKFSNMQTSKLKLWFNFGIIFAVIFMVVGTTVLAHTLWTTVNTIFFKPQTAIPEKPVLSVIVPGVNLPLQDMAYLLPTIFLSAILHELGHAVAATREGVQLNAFGIFAFLIYPGAFVDLNSDDMNRKDAMAKLRVYCAGVWHNFIICIIASVLLLSLPLLIYPFYYKSSSAVLVTYITPNTPLSGPTGLQLHDKVLKIDSCQVSNATGWFNCLEQVKKSPQWGSCMPQRMIRAQTSHTAFTSDMKQKSDNKNWQDCCNPQAPPTHLCYQYNSVESEERFACLPGRLMVSTHEDCMSSNDCLNENDSSSVCAKAHTEPGLKFMRLVVERSGHETRNVLYVGTPTDIIKSVTVSELMPRLPIYPIQMPNIIQRFLQYMFSMSGALALLNIVPCYALDGQYAFKALLDYFDDRHFCSQYVKQVICSITLALGTSLLALNVLLGFINMFVR